MPFGRQRAQCARVHFVPRQILRDSALGAECCRRRRVGVWVCACVRVCYFFNVVCFCSQRPGGSFFLAWTSVHRFERLNGGFENS